MNICVIGAGAWGTAFSLHLLRLGHAVTLVPRRSEQALALASTRENADYLPGFPLPPDLRITHELGPALRAAEVVLLACPTQALRAWCGRLRDSREGASRLQLVVSLAKGLELGTHLRPSGVIQALLPSAVGRGARRTDHRGRGGARTAGGHGAGRRDDHPVHAARCRRP